MKLDTLFHAAFLALVTAAQAQGTFTNLNFESAGVLASQPPSTFVDIAIALPGWSAFVGTNQFNTVLYNNETIGSSGISLLGANAASLDVAIEDSFSALLQAGLYPPLEPSGFTPTEASLRQTGLVPLAARSIQFKAFQAYGSSRPFTVSLDGQTLILLPLEVTPTYTLYGADLTPFAGQTKELRFTALPTANGALNNLNLDSIIFSPEIVPEPSMVGLCAFGALLLVKGVGPKH